MFLKTLTLVYFAVFSISLFSQNIDIRVLENINLNRNRDLDPTFQLFSNSVNAVTITTPLIVYSTGLIGKNKDIKIKGLVMIQSILVSTIISKPMKYIISRERPFVTYPYPSYQPHIYYFATKHDLCKKIGDGQV